jgi:mannitol/fructose-specific phosphotransferase system IIA component (Ntr-type)
VAVRKRRRREKAGAADIGNGQALQDAFGQAQGLRASTAGREPEPESLRLTELVREDLIKIPLAAADQWAVVGELVAVMIAAGEMPRRLASAAVNAVREREAIRPTGWKNGLAFPSGRVPGLRRIAAAVGISPAGVPFGCRDGLPARIVVLLFFPEAGYARYAAAVQDIAETFEDPYLRETLVAAREPAEVIQAVEEAETWEMG